MQLLRFLLSLLFLEALVVPGQTYTIPPEFQPDEQTFHTISDAYARLLANLDCDKGELKELFTQELRKDTLDTSDGFPDSSDTLIWASSPYQPLTFTLYHADLKVRSVGNYALEQFLKEHRDRAQKVPALSLEQALQVAKGYLKKLDCAIPSNYDLSEANFNFQEPSQWSFRWRHRVGSYFYDSTDLRGWDTMSVSFHETLGFGGFGAPTPLPEPSSLEVKVTREEAIVKAAKVLPLIQRTPYYLQARVPGFVVKTVTEASLLIAAPNWLLDPKRVIWIMTKLPTEMRLCWVVKFATVNGKPEPTPNAVLVPPDFWVSIDAATGEIVGASFN